MEGDWSGQEVEGLITEEHILPVLRYREKNSCGCIEKMGTEAIMYFQGG